jgi:hypothetical protein
MAVEARRKRAEEEAQREAAAKQEQAQRDAAEAERTAAVNEQLERTRQEMNKPGYVSPEGEVKPVQGVTPSQLAAQTDPKFRTQLAEQRTKMVDDEIKREEKLRAAELKDKAAAQDRDEKLTNKALNEVERFERAVDARDARVARLEQLMYAQQQRALIAEEKQEVAQLRRAIAMDDKVEDARALLEDDARLYGRAREAASLVAKEAGQKLSKSELEEATRAKMREMREASGWYQQQEDGTLVFDSQTSRARLDLESREPITVESYHATVTPEELARAKQIRYTMPRSMRDWKAGAWKAAGLDEATAIRMAALGSQQAGRDAVTEAASSASGRKEPVAASTASAGIGMGNSRPAPPPPQRKPAPKPPAPQLAGPKPAPGGPASGARPAPPPSSPAPGGPATSIAGGQFGLPQVKVVVPESMRKRDTKEQVLSGKMVGEKAAAGQRKFENVSKAITGLEGVSEKEGKELAIELAQKVPGVFTGQVSLKDGLEQLREIKRYETEAQMGALQEQLGEGASVEQAVAASLDPKLEAQARGTMVSDAERAAEVTPEKLAEQQFGQAVQLLDRPRLELQTRVAQAIGADLQPDPNSPTGLEDPASAAGRGLSSLLVEHGFDEKGADTAGQVFGEILSEALDPLEILGAVSGLGVVGKVAKGAERAMGLVGGVSAAMGAKDAVDQLKALHDSGEFLDEEGRLSAKGAAALTQLGISAGFGAASAKGILGEAGGAPTPKISPDGSGYRVTPEMVEAMISEQTSSRDLVAAIDREARAKTITEKAQAAGEAVPTEEQVNAILDREDAASLSAEPDSFVKAAVGEKVATPEGMDAVLPGQTWVKVDESTYGTTFETPSGPRQLNVRVNEGAIVMSAADLKETRGVEALAADEEVQGRYVPGDISLGRADLIQTLSGTGANTKAHEVLHFLKANGLIGTKQWATISARYAPKAKAAFSGDWQKLTQSQRDNLIEEAAADGFGEYARRRVALRSAPAPVRVFSQVWEGLHSMGSRLVGKDSAEFDRLLRGEYSREAVQAAPAAQPATRPATQQAAPSPAPSAAPAPAQAAQKAPGRKGTKSPKKTKPTTQVEGALPPSEPGAVEAAEAQEAQAQARAKRRKPTAAEVKAKAQAKVEGKPTAKASVGKAAEGDTVTLYRGASNADKGQFWTTDRSRAESYADWELETVTVPRAEFERGRAAARRQGDPTGRDTVLDRAWDSRATKVAREGAAIEVDATEADDDAFLASLGVTRASVGKRKALDVVKLREKPKPITGTGKKGKVIVETDLYPWLEANGTDLSDPALGLTEKQQVAIMVRAAVKEIEYQKKQRRSGAGWYRGDIRELEHAARKAFPSLADPNRMGLFKAVLAATSFGNKPVPNAEQAFQIWEAFEKTGDLPNAQASGKNWSGSPTFGNTKRPNSKKTSRGKLLHLRDQLGSWDAVTEFLLSDHPVGMLRKMGFNVSGKAKDSKPGSYVLGPKGGPFYQNISGRLGDLTGDLWFARTFNRLRGTKIVEAPRNDAERAMMRDFIAKVAKATGVDPADAQAMLWFSEKDLYGKLTGNPDFGTYSIGGRQALESMRVKREMDETGNAPAATVAVKPQVSFEAAWSTNSKLNKQYPWGDLTTEQKRRFTDEHGRWVIEEIHIETGADIEFVTGSTGPSSWGGQPNLVAIIRGSADQVSAAASMLGLAFEQDSVAIVSEVRGQTPQSVRTFVVTSPTSGKWASRDFLDSVRSALEGESPEVAKRVAIEVGVTPSGETTLKAYPMAEAGKPDAEWVRDNTGTVDKAVRSAVAAADPDSAIRVRKAEFEVELPGNDWSTDQNGEGYRRNLDDLGHSPEGLDQFLAGVAANRAETWAAVTGKEPTARASVARRPRPASEPGGDFFSNPGKIYDIVEADDGSEVVSARPPQSGMRQQVIVQTPDGKIEDRAYSVFGNRVPISRASVGKRQQSGSLSNTIRWATKPIIKRLREIKSVGGRPIGEFLADQLESRRRAYEMTSGRMLDRYNVAVGRLDGVKAKWAKVQQALDGVPEAKGKLNDVERQSYDEIRALFNEVKKMAAHEGVFTGQGIRDYFPHMAEDGQFSEDFAVQQHLEYLETERPDLLQKLAEENSAWTGLIGDASNYELAAIDLAKNWNKESFFKSNPHLEKFRSNKPAIKYRTDSAVGQKYILDALRRIMDARYLGSKSEVIQQGIRSIRDQADQQYVRDAMSEILGRAKSRHVGTAIVRELNALNGLSKLGSAGLAQLGQLVVATSEMAGASGVIKAGVDIARGAVALARSPGLLYTEAARSGATFASDSGEAMKNFAGTGGGSYAERVHRAVWRALALGSKAGEKVVDTTYGVRTLDKFARVMADRFGRETYLRALRNKDRALLIELLGSPEHADAALREDLPRLKQIEATWRAGGTDPLLSDKQTVAAGSRLALAGKRFADKTQYRTDTQDQPLSFSHPVMKAANTFYSFAYSHWRWNAEHIQAGRAAAKAGDSKSAGRHARALVMQHLITGPIVGAAIISARALLTGKGLEDKDEDDIQSFAEAWQAAMNLDTIGSEEFWTAHTMVAKFLQGWQYSGGLGYPMSYLERAERATKEYDRMRGFASLVLGSPGEMGYDIANLAADGWNYSWTPTAANQKKVTRAFYTVLFNHTLPNVLGITGSVRRRLTATEERPNRQLGWLGLFDPDARWTKEHGWTSDAAEEAREEALERLREKQEREREELEEE